MATKKSENEILGIDIGNCFVKTSTGVSFPSKTTTNVDLNENRIMFDGKEMLIGSGNIETDINKSRKENMLPLLYEAIRRSTDADNVKVVVGLPIGQYKLHRDSFEEHIRENSTKRIGGRTITIEDVKVVPEGVSAVFNIGKEEQEKIANRDVVIIDIGGRTTDVVLMKMQNGKRVSEKPDTLYNAVFDVYADIVRYVKEKYTVDFKLEDAEDIINNGLFLNGEEQETTFIKEIILSHFREMIKELNLRYNLANGYIYLTGGGSKIFKPFFQKFKNTIVSPDAIMDNAKSYERIGQAIWQRK